MRIFNKTKNAFLAENAESADNFFSRLKGLLGRSTLDAGKGLVITRCNSIHTFFMAFAIDVIFVNRKNTIVGLVKNIPPWRASRIYWPAFAAIELPAGVIERSNSAEGDEITFPA